MALKTDFPIGQIDNGNFALYNQLFLLGSSRTTQQEIDFQNLFTLLYDYLIDAEYYNEIINKANRLKLTLEQANRDVAQLYLQDAIHRLIGEITGKMPFTQSKFFETPEIAPDNSVGHIDFTKAYCSSAVQGTDNITVDSMIHGNIEDFVGRDTHDYTTPTVITATDGVVSYPNADKIVTDSKGNLYATYSSSSQIYVVKSIDNGETWVDTGFPQVVGYSQSDSAIAVDNNDNLHVVWSGRDSDNPSTQIKYSKFTTSWSSWINIQVISGYAQANPSLAIDSNNYLHVVWYGLDPSIPTFNQIKYSKFTTSWSAWINISVVAGSNEYRPTIVIDNNDYLHVAWYGVDAGNTSNQIKYSKFTTSWSAWINIQEINGYAQMRVSMVIDSLNNIHIVWSGVDVSNPTYSQIKYSKFTTSWSAWINISVVVGNTQSDPAVAVDKYDNIHVVWYGQDTSNPSATQIKYSKFTTSWSAWDNIVDGKTSNQDNPAICRTLKDFQKPLVIWRDTQVTEVKLYGLWATGSEVLGREVTLQDKTNKEVLTVLSVIDSTITFKSNIINSYVGAVNVYRSNLDNNWGMGGINDISTLGITTVINNLPSASVRSAAFSSDDTYMALGYVGAPGIDFYKKNGEVYDKLASPIEGLPSSGNGVVFTPDDNYVIAVTSSTPYIQIYERTGDNFAKLSDSNIDVLPNGTARGVDITPDGNYVIIGTNTSPRIVMYSRSGGTLSKWSEPSETLSGTVYDVKFSKDGTYASAVGSAAPYQMTYKRNAGVLTKLATPDALTGLGIAVEYSPDEKYLIMGHITSPYMSIFKRSGDIFTKLADPSDLPTGLVRGISFRSDNSRVIMAHDNSPYITIYDIDTVTDTFTKIDSTGISLTAACYLASYTNDDSKFLIGIGDSPYASMFLESQNVETPVNDIDIRLNINPYTDIGSIAMWLLNNQLGAYTAFASVVGTGVDESYTPMSAITTDLGSQDEVYFAKSGLPVGLRVTAKINITRPDTVTDVKISQIIGGVF